MSDESKGVPAVRPKDLRDEFAMAALTGLLADPSVTDVKGSIARSCYLYADDMLEALKS